MIIIAILKVSAFIVLICFLGFIAEKIINSISDYINQNKQ
jgi:hypothetical protein